MRFILNMILLGFLLIVLAIVFVIGTATGESHREIICKRECLCLR